LSGAARGCALEARLDLRQEAARCVFNQIEHAIETVCPAVVRVRHLADARLAPELEEQAQPVFAARWTHGLQVQEILPIHCEHVVESLEIVESDGPGSQGIEHDPPPQCRGASPLIGPLAHVVGMSTGRVDMNPVAKTLTLQKACEYTLCSGRTADVAQTDEQDGKLFLRIHTGVSLSSRRRTATVAYFPILPESRGVGILLRVLPTPVIAGGTARQAECDMINSTAADQLHQLIGMQVLHQGVRCEIIEVLDDGPLLVLARCEERTVIQSDQYGDARRRVRETFTIPVLAADGSGPAPAFDALIITGSGN
jgi:hypothetical protein